MEQIAASTPTRPDAEGGFRPDVEGLRGVAVLLVVLFHAGLPLPGGFVGVDVFFVISGFLITGLLLREHERKGRVDLARFYARRIRRLLPAAFVVLIATLLAAYALVGPLDRPGVMGDGAASILSIANIRFALAEGDYFTSMAQPSPFLHFWSLSVEEQFYLVWPALLFVVAGGRRRWVVAVLAAVLAASFAASVALTDSSISWAFYSLPTRAWQLATGGLLAVAAASLSGRAVPMVVRASGAVVGWAALAALVAAAVLLDGSVAYPGLFAVVPTLAAAALLTTGPLALGAGGVLRSAPIRFFGRISYSLYLWHWPLLVLAPLAIGRALETPEAAVVASAAVVVSWLSWRFVEEPFRRGRVGVHLGTRGAIRTGLVGILAVALLAGGLDLGSIRTLEQIAFVEPVPTPTTEPTTGPTATPGATTPGSTPSSVATPAPPPATAVPTLDPLMTWKDIVERVPTDPIRLTASVRPTLLAVRDDGGDLGLRCISQADDLVPASCVFGRKAGTFTVALIGDSHAGSWFPAFEAVAKARGWRLVPYIKLSCPFIDMAIEHLMLKREYTECATWRDAVIARLVAQPPDLTVVAMSHRGIFPVDDADKTVAKQSAAIASAMGRIPGRHAIVVDSPRTDVDIPACIAAHPDDVRPCAIPRTTAFTSLFGAREARVVKATGYGLIDLIPEVCPATPCQVIHDGMIVYRDNHHLTATFSASLAPELETQLRRILDGPPR